MRVKVIINPAAGQAEPILSVLNDVFGPLCLSIEKLTTVDSSSTESERDRSLA